LAVSKKNNTTSWMGLTVLIILLGLMMFLFFGKRINWEENYKPSNGQPYGTLIFHELMKKVRGSQTFILMNDSIHSELPESNDSIVDNYIYIGSTYYADSTDLKRLLDFVAAGNKAFVISNQSNLITDSLLTATHRVMIIEDIYDNMKEDLPAEVLDEIDEYEGETDANSVDETQTIEEEYDRDFSYEEEYTTYTSKPEELPLFYYLEDTLINIHTGKSEVGAFKLSRYYKFKRSPYSWSYFSDSIRTKQEEPINVLSHFNGDYINYIRFKHGAGEIYIHTTPLVFTNFNMLNDTAMNYCRNSLQYMGDGKVYWDEENRIYNYKSPAASEPWDPNKPQEGPLEFILSEPGLSKAWYVLLAGTIIYLFFGSKRKQRVIQNMDNMENTSIEYAEVLSQMFMNQKDHKKLVTMKMDMFKGFLRDRYGIKLPLTMNEEDDEFYKGIALKSNVEKNIISDIFEQYKILGSIVEVETAEMLQFHNKLNRFYNTSK